MLYPAHSALVHFFAGAVPVARIERIRGITCYLYRDRDGKEIAAFWNNTVDRKFKLTFKSEGISLYDLYGNKLAVRKDQPVGQNPCFLRGSDLRKVLSDARIAAGTGLFHNRRPPKQGLAGRRCSESESSITALRQRR